MEIWGNLKGKFKSKQNCVVPNCETKRNKKNSQVTLFSGGLIIPSKDVTDLCLVTNKYFKHANINFKNKHQDERLALRILQDFNLNKLFPSLHSHQYDTEIANNHIYKLTKSNIKCFIKIKFSQISKQINEANATHIRQQVSRLIIFRHE